MKKRAAVKGQKQQENPVAMSTAMQQLMLPLLLAMNATNGAAMLSAETTEGLERLGIVHHTWLHWLPASLQIEVSDDGGTHPVIPTCVSTPPIQVH